MMDITFNQLPTNVIYNITHNLTYNEIVNMCTLNKKLLSNLCNSETFWRYLIYNRYPYLKIPEDITLSELKKLFQDQEFYHVTFYYSDSISYSYTTKTILDLGPIFDIFDLFMKPYFDKRLNRANILNIPYEQLPVGWNPFLGNLTDTSKYDYPYAEIVFLNQTTYVDFTNYQEIRDNYHLKSSLMTLQPGQQKDIKLIKSFVLNGNIFIVISFYFYTGVYGYVNNKIQTTSIFLNLLYGIGSYISFIVYIYQPYIIPGKQDITILEKGYYNQLNLKFKSNVLNRSELRIIDPITNSYVYTPQDKQAYEWDYGLKL